MRDLRTGVLHDVSVHCKVVDARYLEASVPATHAPAFAVASGARVVPINDLPAAARSASCYTVLGSGKTAVDACTWLLDNDVEPERIRWVRPRDAWLHHRADFQPLEQVGAIMAGLSHDAEAGAQAEDVHDLFERLEASGRLVRIDRSRPATMYRGTMLSGRELDALRQIEDVIRLGHVRRIESDRIALEQGEARTGPEILHVDCTALGLRNAPATPIFQPGRIVLQQVRHNTPPFNAALVGFVEAVRDDDAEKNKLCPPNPYASSIHDWPQMMSRTWRTERRWLSEPDVVAWLAESRLNLLRALPDHLAEPPVQIATQRFLTHVGAAIEQLEQIDESGSSDAARAVQRDGWTRAGSVTALRLAHEGASRAGRVLHRARTGASRSVEGSLLHETSSASPAGALTRRWPPRLRLARDAARRCVGCARRGARVAGLRRSPVAGRRSL